MFGRRFWGGRYFGPRYWGEGGEDVPPPPPPPPPPPAHVGRSEVRFQVADRWGRLIAELEPLVESVEWRLNNVGRLHYQLSQRDTKAIADYFRYGNLVYLQLDNGLPPWGGVIDTPQDWVNGIIRATAYSGEKLLDYRQTSRGRYFNQTGVGHIFTSVITGAAGVWPLLVNVGEVWPGGGIHSPSYHFRSLLDVVRVSIGTRLSPADFVVRPVVAGDSMDFTGDLYRRRGRDLPGVALVEDANVAEARLKEQGDIVNSWAVVGEGTTWGDERPIVYVQNDDSIAVYGLREGRAIYSDTKELETLQATADNLLAQSAWPRVMLDLVVLDAGPGRFNQYDVGDAVWVSLPSYGFGGYEGLVRILARTYFPERGVCELVVEAWEAEIV
jgi:hypothetical protein